MTGEAPRHEPQRRLGDFILGRRIAVGGMAEVFEARRAAGGGPPVVVKVLLPQYAGDPEVVETLRHEAEIASTLTHDAIVRVVAFGTDGEDTWLAMERVDGGTLASLVAHARERGQRLPLPAALHVGMELLSALGHVHDAKSDAGASLAIVHRDVTPENVLVSRSGDVKLADFGIARSIRRGGRTRTGVIKGKLAYLSPEQATGSALDARTDLYAAGAVIWELVTGERWLDAESEVDLLRIAAEPKFRAPSEMTGAPEALDLVLERALRRFPEERWATAQAMRDGLASIAASVGSDGRAALAALAVAAFGAAPPAPQALDADGRRAPPRTRWTVQNALLALAAAAAVALGLRIAIVGTGEGTTAGDGAAPSVEPRSDAAVPASGSPVDAASGAVASPPRDAGADAGPHDGGRPRSDRSSRRLDAGMRRRDAGLAPQEARGGPLRARRDALLAILRTRGISSADLAPSVRANLDALDRALGESRWGEAERLLAEVEPAAASARVDAAFVRRRLDRVDRRIDAARREGADTRELENLAAGALQLFLDGRLDETNRRLDDIEARLR